MKQARASSCVIVAVAIATSLFCADRGFAASAKAPKGFFGVHVRSLDGGNYNRMRKADVGLARTGFAFSTAKAREASEYNWSGFDGIVAGTARSGIDLLPVVYGLPPWLPGEPRSILSGASGSAWRDYLTALVTRYGAGGEFWRLNPDIPYQPVETWQIWNEPNSFVNWSTPDPREYGKLLSSSAKTIHAVDARAKIVSAGVVSRPQNDEAMSGAAYLRRMFRSRPAARATDIVAVHPYTRTVQDAKRLISQARKVMKKAGLKRTPIWVTEIGWGANTGAQRIFAEPLDVRRWDTSAAKQRKNLRRSFEMAVRQRKKLGIRKVVWYQWQEGEDGACGWCETSGLLKENGVGKQLLAVFSRIARL